MVVMSIVPSLHLDNMPVWVKISHANLLDTCLSYSHAPAFSFLDCKRLRSFIGQAVLAMIPSEDKFAITDWVDWITEEKIDSIHVKVPHAQAS
ncbi:hypothetical protein D3C78_1747450 [compost metagenome]